MNSVIIELQSYRENGKIFSMSKMNALQIFLIITAVVVAIAILAIIVYRRRSYRDFLGCRVKYEDSVGTTFGYISREEPGNLFIVQNPWKKYETVPMGRSSVEFIDADDWKVVDTKTGDDIWNIESSASAKEMFKFHGIAPRTC